MFSLALLLRRQARLTRAVFFFSFFVAKRSGAGDFTAMPLMSPAIEPIEYDSVSYAAF